jgi:magnesium transporter
LFRSLNPGVAAAALALLDPATAAAFLRPLPTDHAAALLRATSEDVRSAIVERLPAGDRRALRNVLEFEAGRAGSLMDANIATLTPELTVREALEAVRAEARGVGYNVLAVDRDRHLVGVLNLQELLQAEPDGRIDGIMKPADHRILAQAGQREILEHPGWRGVSSLPVVDAEGRLLGVLRYQVFRRLQEEAGQWREAAATTSEALADLFRAGLGGVLETLTSAGIGSAAHPHPKREEEPDRP